MRQRAEQIWNKVMRGIFAMQALQASSGNTNSLRLQGGLPEQIRYLQQRNLCQPCAVESKYVVTVHLAESTHGGLWRIYLCTSRLRRLCQQFAAFLPEMSL